MPGAKRFKARRKAHRFAVTLFPDAAAQEKEDKGSKEAKDDSTGSSSSGSSDVSLQPSPSPDGACAQLVQDAESPSSRSSSSSQVGDVGSGPHVGAESLSEAFRVLVESDAQVRLPHCYNLSHAHPYIGAARSSYCTWPWW